MDSQIAGQIAADVVNGTLKGFLILISIVIILLGSVVYLLWDKFA